MIKADWLRVHVRYTELCNTLLRKQNLIHLSIVHGDIINYSECKSELFTGNIIYTAG